MQSDIITRFNTVVSLGDSLLQVMEVKTGMAECRLKFDFGRILSIDKPSIFDPKAKFAPASLLLRGVKSIIFDGEYQLNSTVIDYGATPSESGEHVEFYLELSGGTDPDAFLVKVTFRAMDFDFGPWVD